MLSCRYSRKFELEDLQTFLKEGKDIPVFIEDEEVLQQEVSLLSFLFFYFSFSLVSFSIFFLCLYLCKRLFQLAFFSLFFF